ncbi:DUF6098 family protein [Isoptericola sp. 4D.3]|uniref:DUF6098 family protein n=1 Tax=Isoptericola peretonis TaxID=2918523 RepID=A0ABT0J8X3_9MICO|nr:DUF6098 family protein [Isoptericola sp. 4D.3]
MSLVTTGVDGLPELASLEDVARLVAASEGEPVYLRFSAGPDADRDAQDCDEESGCPLPGLSVSPLTPEPWWEHSVECWVARQLRRLVDFDSPADDRFPWVLTGRVVARGPDCEPLLVDVQPLGRIGLGVIVSSLASV